MPQTGWCPKKHQNLGNVLEMTATVHSLCLKTVTRKNNRFHSLPIKGKPRRPRYRLDSGKLRNRSVGSLFPLLKPLQSLCLLAEMCHPLPNSRWFRSNCHKSRLISAIFAYNYFLTRRSPFSHTTNFNTFITKTSSFHHSRHIKQHEDIIKKP